ncbi:inner kinetochore subunit wip1 [Aplysia californica]|uniref:Inner kinetochore subunit wip1 n=1 Tax=Aplysia californica TaxID=6500 RepID=A0ABM0JKE8_APLCA|nr:inner kinetochore subunit wip1 [Aplysia californica]
MTAMSHFSRPKIKKRSALFTRRVKLSKNSALSLLFVHYSVFLQSLMKAATTEARDKRARNLKAEHIKAVAKRVLKKYR